MRKYICFIFIVIMIVSILSGCVSTQQSQSQGLSNLLTKDKLDLIDEAVCEIVVKKSDKDSLTYEEDIQQYMDLLPLWYRNDDFLAIGTAFAVSETKMLTAMHVLSLDNLSLIYNKFYIRDKDKKVYELGNLSRVHNLKDIIEFEAQGKKFSKWFNLTDKIELNTPVISVGSILGEGIIKRSGLLTSKKPNELDGIMWDTLSFSADASPGNSGGPLLNNKGDVVGLILARNEEQKLGFALPSHEILMLKENKAVHFSKMTYGFVLIQDKNIETYSFETDLPMDYTEYRKKLMDNYWVFYEKSMQKLFDDNKETTFPKGKKSMEALQTFVNSSFPEVYYEDKDDKQWFISSTKTSKSELDKNGYISMGKNGSFVFLKMRKPDDMSLAELYSDPKLYMDMILKVTNESRQIASNKIRITSYGEPFKSFEHVDKYKRKWQIHYWLVEINDSVIMTFSLPHPMGMATVFKTINSTQYLTWEYDYLHILDFITVGYYGTFESWQEFLSLDSYIPENFKSMSIDYKEDEFAKITLDNLDINIDTTIFDITGKSDLFIGLSVHKENDELTWGPCRISVGEDENKTSFFSIRKQLKYAEGLPDSYKENWESVVKMEHPLDGKPYYDDNMTRISMLHHNYRDRDTEELMNASHLYSFYLAIDKKLEDEEIIDKMTTLDDAITINESKGI